MTIDSIFKGIPVFLIMVCVSLRAHEWQVHEVTIHQKKEVIDGTTFIARHEVADGMSTHALTINGRLVDEGEYQEAILQAEKEMRRKVRVQEEAQLAQENEAKNSLALAVHKKIIALHIAHIEQEMHKLERNNLRPFFLFSPTTFSNADDVARITDQLLPQARTLIDAPSGRYAVHTYASMASMLEPIAQRLKDLFYATLQNAITVCNDTKMLKELLEIVA